VNCGVCDGGERNLAKRGGGRIFVLNRTKVIDKKERALIGRKKSTMLGRRGQGKKDWLRARDLSWSEFIGGQNEGKGGSVRRCWKDGCRIARGNSGDRMTRTCRFKTRGEVCGGNGPREENEERRSFSPDYLNL